MHALSDEAVKVKGLSVSVGGYEIFSDVSFKLLKGSAMLLAGPSGSGKTTLLKVIAGLIPGLYTGYRVRGEVSVYGANPTRSLREGLIAYVPQDPTSFFLNASVRGELLFTGIDPYTIGISENKLIHELSDGQLYRLLLASALSAGVKLLLLDEPTSHIDPWTLHGIVDMLNNFRLRGGSIIIVDHRADIFGDFVENYLVLNGCGWKLTGLRRDYRGIRGELMRHGSITVQDVWVRMGRTHILRGVSLNVGSGSALSIVGKNGAGKTTLLKVVSGLVRRERGEVHITGRIFYIPQTPIKWFSSSTVEAELKLFAHAWGYKGSIDEVLEVFDLNKTRFKHPYILSVGESRRLSLALAFVSSADVIILDEPGLGLDDLARKALAECLEELMDLGASVLTAGHDLRLADSLGQVCMLADGVLKC